MNDEERRKAAKDLVQAIKDNKNGAYDKWVSHTGLGDRESRAKFVKDTLELQHEPSGDDLKAMQNHMQQELAPHIKEIQEKHKGAHVVGQVCLAEESEPGGH